MINLLQPFRSDGENVVFDLNANNVDLNSVTVKIKGDTDNIYAFSTIEPAYVILEEVVEEGKIIEIRYNTKEVKFPVDRKELEERLASLESSMLLLQADNKKLLEAINNRVAVRSFNAWKALIETKTGLKFIDSNMTDIETELSNSTIHK